MEQLRLPRMITPPTSIRSVDHAQTTAQPCPRIRSGLMGATRPTERRWFYLVVLVLAEHRCVEEFAATVLPQKTEEA